MLLLLLLLLLLMPSVGICHVAAPDRLQQRDQ
jgi:hypothetical protein